MEHTELPASFDVLIWCLNRRRGSSEALCQVLLRAGSPCGAVLGRCRCGAITVPNQRGSSGQELSGAGKVHEALTKDWCTWKEFDVKEKRKGRKHTTHRAHSVKF